MAAPRQLKKYRSDRQVLLFQSIKNGRTMWAESHLERNSLRYLEYLDDVVSFEEQPAQFAYIDDKNKERNYTPDIKTINKDGVEAYLEVKPQVFTKSRRAKERFNHLRMLFTEVKGVDYSYLTDAVVYEEKLTKNLKQIHHFRKLSLSKINISNLVVELGKSPSFGELIQYLKPLGFVKKYALSVLGNQIYKFDYKQELNEQTLLTLSEA
ncbi:MAG: hypothetical protein ACI9YH_004217 [Colwellia sp.]|jgi:hypothetical protein